MHWIASLLKCTAFGTQTNTHTQTRCVWHTQTPWGKLFFVSWHGRSFTQIMILWFLYMEKSMQVYSEISSITVNSTYSWVRVHWIVVLLKLNVTLIQWNTNTSSPPHPRGGSRQLASCCFTALKKLHSWSCSPSTCREPSVSTKK